MLFHKRLIPLEGSAGNFIDQTCRIFEPIRIKGDYFLSIQASYGHRCKPRVTLEDLDDYTHWEIAVYNENDFVRISDVAPEFRSLAEIELYRDGTAYNFVPTDLVGELYSALK